MKWFHRLKERQQRYHAVFDGEDGQWVLADLARDCGYMQDSHVPNDPTSTSYNAGREWVYKHILSILGMSEHRMAALVSQYEEMERRKDEGIFGNE